MKRAFYDLAVSPHSFDFAQFLLCAKIQECDEVVIVRGTRMVPDGKGGLIEFQKCSVEEQAKRIEHIFLGLCPDAKICERETARELWHENCYPKGYTVDAPVMSHTVGSVMSMGKLLPMFPSPEAVADVKADGLENVITISIRNCSIKPARNSNVAAWIEIADWLSELGHRVIFIPDNDNIIQEFGKHQSSTRAAENVQYRLALYNASILNLGINHGPMSLNFFSRRPMLYFKPVTDGCHETSPDSWKKSGILPNSQPPWFTSLQRIIWAPDDCAVIKENIERWFSAQNGKDAWPLSVAPAYPIFGVVNAKGRGEQMANCLTYNFPKLKRKPHGEEWLSIVCFGPSLKETWREIPHPMITVSGAHDFLISRNVIPDYHMDCDPREHKAMFTAKPHIGVKYLMASVCHAKVWEQLKDSDVAIWHLHNGPETDEWIAVNDPGVQAVGGGSTAGARAFEIGSMLGYKKFRVFGMDGNFEGKHRHAGKHTGKAQSPVDVNVGNCWFKSSPQMIEGCKEIIHFMSNYDVELEFYGDGLQQHMVTCFRNKFRVIPKQKELKAWLM